VPRDLETICLKCLEKQPRKRYASTEELADDLARFLAGEPIRARPTPAWERSIKWVRRRPALASLLGVSGVAAVTVLAVVLISNARLKEQRDYAEDRRKEAVANFRKARDAVDLMLTRVGQESLAHVPHMEKIRRNLLEDALKFYQDFARQAGNDPEVRYEMGRAHRRLGGIYESLGDRQRAEQSVREAVAVQEELIVQFPTEVPYRRELGLSYRHLGSVLINRRPKEAEEAFRHALDLQEKLAAADPAEPGYSTDLADTHDDIGILLAQAQRHSAAEKEFRHATDLLEKLVARYPSVADYGEKLAVCRGNLGNLLAQTNRLADAEKLLRQNADFWEKRASDDPTGANARSKLALTQYNLGLILHNLGRPVEAEPAIRRALELRTRFMEDFPNIPELQNRVGEALRKLAVLVRVNRGDHAEAQRLLEKAIGHTKAALKTDARNPSYLRMLGYEYTTLADTLIDLGDHVQAARTAERVPPLMENVEEAYCDAARRLARCMPLAAKDANLSDDKRKELAQAYADRAVQLLREAIQKGYKDVGRLEMDPAFDSLRAREDFRMLLQDGLEKCGPMSHLRNQVGGHCLPTSIR
jgi:tetratricopeptide (TPR) repeat protein